MLSSAEAVWYGKREGQPTGVLLKVRHHHAGVRVSTELDFSAGKALRMLPPSEGGDAAIVRPPLKLPRIDQPLSACASRPRLHGTFLSERFARSTCGASLVLAAAAADDDDAGFSHAGCYSARQLPMAWRMRSGREEG